MSEHIVGVNPKEYNGKMYRSTLEADTARLLDEMGLPWEYETKKITLQDGFYCQYQKDKVRAIEYIPDFTIGPIILETKGFETPDWKIKKKLLYKHLSENDPDAIFYMVKTPKQLLEALDKHWQYLGYYIEVWPKPKKMKGYSRIGTIKKFDSIEQAMQELGLKGKSITPILRSLTGRTEYVYNYSWKLKKLTL